MRRSVILASVVCVAFAQTAFAADQRPPVLKARPAAVEPVFTWTGFYIGGHFGGGWGRKEWRDPLGPPFDIGSHDVSGALGGGQIGFNYQTGPFVFGAEGTFSWADLTGSHNNPFEPADQLSTRTRWLATAAARVGYAVQQALLYGKFGAAWARDEHRIIDLGVVEGIADVTRTGWLVGAGGELALWSGWSARVEYNFMDFGRRTIDFVDPAGPPTFPLEIRQQIHTVTVGLNYRFGLGAVTARY